MTRTNFATNPSAAVAVTNFAAVPGAGGAASVAYNSGAGYSGNGFARVSWSTAPTTLSGGVSYTQTGLTALTQYTCQVWVRSSKAQQVALTAVFQTSGAVTVNTVLGATVAVPADTWMQVTVVGTSGASVDRVILSAEATTGGTIWVVGDLFDADAVCIEAATTVGTYFDGSSVPVGNRKYAWTGVANASTSVDSPIVTVSVQPSFAPPRNEVAMAINAGDTMSTASLTRIQGGLSVLTRTQPSTGFDTRVVEDYECAYGQTAQYRFISDYIDTSQAVTLWDEVWASLSAWTAVGNPFTVSGGQVHFAYGEGTLTRPVTTGSYRVTIGSITSTVAGSDSPGCFVQFGNFQIGAFNGGNVWVSNDGGLSQQTTAISPALQITIDFFGTSIVVSGSGGSYTFSNLSSTDFSSARISGQVLQYGSFSVGEIKLVTYPPSIHIDATSDPVELDPVNPWLIHPASPGLSIPIGSADRSLTTIRTLGDVTNPSAATEHQILGQSNPITTTSGPRFSNRLTVMLATKTRTQELALNALLNDGTPLLVRAPSTFDIGFDEGFYSVGDAVRGRISQRPGDPYRQFTLPLTGVQSPIVTVQNTGWSYAGAAAAFAAYAVVSTAYSSYSDLLVDNRKPGY